MRRVNKDREKKEKEKRKVSRSVKERESNSVVTDCQRPSRRFNFPEGKTARTPKRAILGHNPPPFIRDDCENFIAEIKMVSGQRVHLRPRAPRSFFSLFVLSRDRESR